MVSFDYGGLFGLYDSCHWSGDKCRCDACKDELVHLLFQRDYSEAMGLGFQSSRPNLLCSDKVLGFR